MKKIKNFTKTIMLPLALLLSANCFAQVADQVAASFNKYQQSIVSEKIFVHTDKSNYLPGEILWFKIYSVDGGSHKPLSLSKVVYVEVLDNNQAAVMQAKIEIVNGAGSGSLYVPVSLSNGIYKLRAYSSWMKNFSPDYYFEKNITIINPLKAPETAAKPAAEGYDMQFFPEGGNLVAGLTSKVAFKVTAKNGMGVSSFNGAVINDHHDTVARFKPLKFGIGNFVFTPAPGNTYKAVISSENGSPVIKDMPAVNISGYVMQLKDNSNGQLTVTVNGSGVDEGEVYLFAHTRQAVKIALSAPFTGNTATFTIDKARLGEGVSHITIFNSAKQPVCERLYFKRPQQQLMLNAGADQAQYASRKKVSVNVFAKDASGKPLAANLSMAVYRVDSLQNMDAGDIYSYLWLKSDLKGGIESADYYFKNTTAEADAAIDNLMLSQGWSRFQWNNVLSNTPPAFSFLPEYNGHLINGKITTTATGSPAKGVYAYLSVPGKRLQFYTSKSDSLGRLIFNTKQLYGPGEIVVQTNSERDSTFRIDIQSPFSDQYSKSAQPGLILTPGMQKAIEEHSLAMQAQNIYSGNKLKQYYDARIDSLGFYGEPSTTYLLDNYTRFTTMEEVLREYVSGILVLKSGNKFHINVINDIGAMSEDPLVLLDGVPIFNIDKVIALDPLKIRKLELVRNRYYWGPSVNDGILSYTTYKGDLGGVELDPHAIVLDYEGMQLQREFYSPVYDTEAATKSRVPDFRNLLYWSPNAGTDEQGKNQISFYTSDQAGKYIGFVQGITASGDAGSQYFSFDVK